MKNVSKYVWVAIGATVITFQLEAMIILKFVAGGGYEAALLTSFLIALCALVSSPEFDQNYRRWEDS